MKSGPSRFLRAAETPGHAVRYFALPGGEPTSSVLKLICEPLRMELRSTLHAAKESGRIARSAPVWIKVRGERRQIVLRVQPARDGALEGFMLVLFDEIDERGPRRRPTSRTPPR